MAAPPHARLVTSLGGAVEPRVHAPEGVQPAGIGGIGVVDDAALERERAHSRPLAHVGGRVGAAHGRHLADGALAVAREPRRLAAIVVFRAALALPLLADADVEVIVE